jgi:hypothetical protein
LRPAVRGTWYATLALACFLAGAGAAEAQDSHVLVIVGLGGDHENADRFHSWAVSIVDAARVRYGLAGDHVVYLGEDPARDPARISGRSTREAVDAAVSRIAGLARPGDRVFIVLIGHGAAATPGTPRFNLPGPDMTAAEFDRLLRRFAAQQVVFVNTASASGGFVNALSGPGRTIITATRTDGERNQTRFGEHFAAALTAPEADQDKDGRTSMLEAFAFTCQQVADSYARDGQLLTEHAVLDDNGDGKGTDTPGQPGSDGAVARTLFMSAAPASGSGSGADDPELRALVDRRQEMERRLVALQATRETAEASQYERDFEALMIELARVNRAIRERQKR